MMYRQLNINGKRFAYQCEGEGPAVVLLHGFAETSNTWNLQKSLAEHFKFLIPDLPGSGNSEPNSVMTMESMADYVYRLLQHERIEKCVLIGHSMGGYVALAFAEKYSERLNGLGLFHSSAFADTDEKIATREKGIAFMQEHGAALFLKSTLPNLYSPTTKEKHPSLVEKQLEEITHFSTEALIAYYKAMIARPDRTEVLQDFPQPVLFILGRHDTAVPLQTGWAQCSLPQIAYIDVLAHSGHMGMVEEPERSNDCLHKFLSETCL